MSASELNTTGPYSMVRHPLYAGNFFMWIGVLLLTRSVWLAFIAVAIFWLYYERIIFAEEQFLQREFGAAFGLWAARTPAFIPRLGRWRSRRVREQVALLLRT